MGDLQDHILDAMRSEGRSLVDVERAADAAGVPHGQKANTSQRAAILAHLYGWSIETPEPARAHAEDPASGGGGSSDPSTASTPPVQDGPDSSVKPDSAATVPGSGSDDPPPESAPSPSELLEQAVALTGGTLVDVEPPRPRTQEYRELPDGVARANAQKYWAERDAAEPEPPTLAEQLGAPLA